MEVSYGDTPVHVPHEATNTEITTYMWPGFLGEFDHTTVGFTAWELVGPRTWLPRPDILSPPFDCIGVSSTVTQTWVDSQQGHWIQQGALWRRLVPQVPRQPQVPRPRVQVPYNK